jgi:hypothetical protein
MIAKAVILVAQWGVLLLVTFVCAWIAGTFPTTSARVLALGSCALSWYIQGRSDGFYRGYINGRTDGM